MTCEWPPSARCCSRCACVRCLCSRMRGQIVMVSQGVAVTQVCSGVWQCAECCVAHCAVWCNVWLMWFVWRSACMYDR